jgi:hypothetical protein
MIAEFHLDLILSSNVPLEKYFLSLNLSEPHYCRAFGSPAQAI